ncbi:3-ketoacyl-CoA thiolase with broad chain length specificity [Boothiomyces sp. JEL0866]|nr:3-ketoacyl-CoA thiolase with broad chain length specificity [Boothiomyces sp. JEL0866]
MTVIDSAQYQLTVSNANQSQSQIPVRYISKLAQHMNEKVVVFAVVSSIKPPFKTKGTDYSMSLSLHDPTIPSTSDGLAINMFDPDIEKFNQLKSGDIVKCRFIVSHFGNKVQGVINKRKEGSVVSVDTIELNMQEKEIVSLLFRYKGNVKQEKVFSSVRPITSIKDIVENGYYDLFGKIILLEKGHGCIMIGLSDFTANPKLQSIQDLMVYNSEFKVPNEMLIIVTCWDLRCNIELGMHVSVRNARSKLDFNGRLELVVHQDTRYIDRLPIKEADRTNEREKEILLEYNPESGTQPVPQPIIHTPALEATSIKNVNNITSIKDVKSCTESKKFRIKVKIVDYMPYKLECFTRPYCQFCKQALNLMAEVEEYTCPTCNDQIADFIFLFSLLVTDDNEHFIPLIFSEMHAIEFLGDFYPSNLMNDTGKVEELRSRLSKYITLIGLDRIKESVDLECWIKSFFVEHKDAQVLRYRFLSLVNT